MGSTLRKRSWGRAAGLLALLSGLSAVLYWRTLWLPPIFHHAWAQADWLALALNFRARSFDFFHPATYNLLTRDGVTGAGFPLPAYLAAVLMALVGSEAPGLMRLLTLGCSLGGLLALGGLVQRASGSPARAVLAVLFVFCSPIYGYYQANYLPSAPAFAAALGGYYCFYRYCQPPAGTGQGGRWGYAAAGFFTLAAAVRTPFAVPLLASLLHLGGRWALLKRLHNPAPPLPQLGRVLATYALGWAALVAIFLYNEHLTQAYGGSMFLARPRPFHGVAEALEITRLVAEKWGSDLLSRAQWAALLAAGLAATARWRPTWRHSEWPAHGLLLAGGGLAYYLLMGPQYIDHDYYFIDSLLLPLVLLFAGSVAGLPWPTSRPAQWAGAALAVALATFWLADSLAVQARRYTPQPDDQGYATLQNFTGAAQRLDAWGVARTARITVLDAHTYNLPLLLMQRRGWTVLTTSEANLRHSFDEPADFVVTQNAFFRAEILQNYPGIRERMDSVASDGYLTLWRPRRAAGKTTEKW